jgi:hypothetical protein
MANIEKLVGSGVALPKVISESQVELAAVPETRP